MQTKQVEIEQMEREKKKTTEWNRQSIWKVANIRFNLHRMKKRTNDRNNSQQTDEPIEIMRAHTAMFVTWLWAHYSSLILNEFYMIIEEWNKKKKKQKLLWKKSLFFLYLVLLIYSFIYLAFDFSCAFFSDFLSLFTLALAKPVKFVQVHLNVVYFSRYVYLSLIRSL